MNCTEAATETVFKNICSFFPGATYNFPGGPFVPRTDMNFPGGSICSSNRHEFSRKVYYVLQTDTNFPGAYSKRHVFSRRFNLFVEQTLLSHRTDINFPIKPLFSPRTHINFPGASIFSSNRYSFPRKLYVPLLEQIFR